MPEYKVTWIIDEEADNHVEAAKQAWKHRNNKDSIANVFTVQEVSKTRRRIGSAVLVDLSDLELPNNVCEKCGEHFINHNDDGSCVKD